MQLSTTIRSPGALALGLFFASVTARTIFDDVWSGAPVTIAHLNAAAALVAAIAAGHMAWPALRQGHIATALGLAVIFVASTGYIVTSAGARNAEVTQAKAAAIVKTNEERDATRQKVAEAEADVYEAKEAHRNAADAAARECGTGKKIRCEGKSATRDYAARDLEKSESHAALMRARFSLIGPEQNPFAGYEHAARVFEAAGLGRAEVIEARLELLMPFALVLITEAGTLVFLGMALGHRGGVQQAQWQTSEHRNYRQLRELSGCARGRWASTTTSKQQTTNKQQTDNKHATSNATGNATRSGGGRSDRWSVRFRSTSGR